MKNVIKKYRMQRRKMRQNWFTKYVAEIVSYENRVVKDDRVEFLKKFLSKHGSKYEVISFQPVRWRYTRYMGYIKIRRWQKSWDEDIPIGEIHSMLESRQIKCRYIIRYKARNVWYKNNPCFVSAVSFIDTLQHGCLYQKLADQYFEWTTTVINYWINRNPFLDDIGLSIIGELKSDLEQDPTMITLDSIALFAFLSGIIIDIRDIKFDLE